MLQDFMTLASLALLENTVKPNLRPAPVVLQESSPEKHLQFLATLVPPGRRPRAASRPAPLARAANTPTVTPLRALTAVLVPTRQSVAVALSDSRVAVISAPSIPAVATAT